MIISLVLLRFISIYLLVFWDFGYLLYHFIIILGFRLSFISFYKNFGIYSLSLSSFLTRLLFYLHNYFSQTIRQANAREKCDFLPLARSFYTARQEELLPLFSLWIVTRVANTTTNLPSGTQTHRNPPRTPLEPTHTHP